MSIYQFEIAQYMREDSENDGVVIKTFKTIEEFTAWLQSMPYDELSKYDVFTMDITNPNDPVDINISLFLYVRN